MYFFWLFRLYEVFHEKLLCMDFFPTPFIFLVVHPLVLSAYSKPYRFRVGMRVGTQSSLRVDTRKSR